MGIDCDICGGIASEVYKGGIRDGRYGGGNNVAVIYGCTKSPCVRIVVR